MSLCDLPSPCGLHRGNNVVVPGTTTEISAEKFSDLGVRFVVCWFRVAKRHEEAGRTKSALQTVMFVKRCLHRGPFPVLSKPFDSPYGSTVCLNGEHQTRADGEIVNDHGACATDPVFASNVRTSEP